MSQEQPESIKRKNKPENNINREEQIAICQIPGDGLPYSTWHDDAERRMKRGQKSKYCSVCERWRWKDKRCYLFEDGGTNLLDD